MISIPNWSHINQCQYWTVIIDSFFFYLIICLFPFSPCCSFSSHLWSVGLHDGSKPPLILLFPLFVTCVIIWFHHFINLLSILLCSFSCLLLALRWYLGSLPPPNFVLLIVYSHPSLNPCPLIQSSHPLIILFVITLLSNLLPSLSNYPLISFSDVRGICHQEKTKI